MKMNDIREYKIWTGMLNRCRNPNVRAFPSYGGRGIKVCDEWKNNFEAFVRDMGLRPSSKHSLDRIDTNGDYEPGNVKWATRREQVNNRRNTRFVTYRGERVPLLDAVRSAGSVIHYEAAWIRIKTGWPVDRAVETPRTMESPASKWRNKKQVIFQGKNMDLAQAVNAAGSIVSLSTASWRLKMGWSVDCALTQPANYRRVQA